MHTAREASLSVCLLHAHVYSAAPMALAGVFVMEPGPCLGFPGLRETGNNLMLLS